MNQREIGDASKGIKTISNKQYSMVIALKEKKGQTYKRVANKFEYVCDLASIPQVESV